MLHTMLLLGLGILETQVLLILLYWVPLVFFILNLQKLLKEVSPENRKIQPVLLWITAIPLIGLLWQFFIVIKISQTLRLEFDKRTIIANEAKPGFGVGLTYCTLFICGIIPGAGFVLAAIGLYYWISYWIKMNDCKKLLRNR